MQDAERAQAVLRVCGARRGCEAELQRPVGRRRWLLRRRLRLRPLSTTDELARFAAQTASCSLCALAGTRTQVVVGEGNPHADLMLVGEAPGFHEDRLGRPFAGGTADLLERLLAGIGLTPGDVYLTTVVKCRPPASRDPLDEEAAACEPHLVRQIELVDPRVVATLGTFATRLLAAHALPLGETHGRPLDVSVGSRTVTLLPLYHPAATLHVPVLLEALERGIATIPVLLGAAPPTPMAVEAPTGPTTQLGLF